MFGRSENYFSRFADTFVTDYGFGFAHCLGVLVILVGQFGRHWQMVWNCPLGYGWTGRDYTLVGGAHAHTRTQFVVQPHSSLVNETCLWLCLSHTANNRSVLISKRSHDYVLVHILMKTIFQGVYMHSCYMNNPVYMLTLTRDVRC